MDFRTVFVNNGSDMEVINSNLDLVKSMGNRSGLVQVNRTVSGKHGTYIRKQWIRPDEIKTSDRVTRMTDKQPKETVRTSLNSIEESNAKARFQSFKFRSGTVVSCSITDNKSHKSHRIMGIVTSVRISTNKNGGAEKTTLRVVDSKGKSYVINTMNPESQVKRCSKEKAENFKGKKLFDRKYFVKTGNSSKSYSELDVQKVFNNRAEGNTTFDEFVKENFYISDGYSETRDAYQKDGKYIPSRRKLHNEIIKGIEDTCGLPPKGSKPICFLLGGGSASGKSSIVNSRVEQSSKDLGVKIGRVDSDEIKKSIPEYVSLQKQNCQNAAYRVHNESSDIATTAFDKLVQDGRCFAFDGTMKNLPKYTKMVEKLHKAGYHIVALGVDIPTEEALKRSADRAKKTNRVVPEGIIKGSHGGFANTFPKIKDMVDSYQLYDNSQPEGEQPTLICDSSGVHNKSLWDAFIKKGTDYLKFKEDGKNGKQAG